MRATVPLVQEKLEKLSAYPDRVRFLFEPVSPDGADPETCRAAAEALAAVEPWETPAIEEALRAFAEGLGPEAAPGVRPDPPRGHGLEGLAGPVREPRAARARRVARAARAPPPSGGTRARSCRPRPCPATQIGHSSAMAPATNIPQPTRISASALSGAREAARLRRLGARAERRRARRACSRASRTRKSAPRHSQTSGSAASAPHSSTDLDDAPGRVARAGERARELGVHGLGAGGRREAEGVLARAVQPVLETAEHLDLLLVLEPLGLGGDRLEPRQRVREAGPQGADLCCVSLPGPRPRSHGFNPRRAAPANQARFPNLYDRRTVTGAGPLILVVEDDASIRLLCRINLELDGFRVEEAATRRRRARRGRGGAARRSSCSTCGSASRTPATCSTSSRGAGLPVVLLSGDDRRRALRRPRDRGDGEAVRADGPRERRATVGERLTCPGLERRRRSHPDRVREPPRAVSLRALRGGPRGARRREGHLRADRDRQALRRPLQRRAARGAARRGGSGRRATSASCSTGCARRARAGSSRPRSSSARTSSRTACSPSASRSRARRCRSATRRRRWRCSRRTPTARRSARSRPPRAPRSTPTASS